MKNKGFTLIELLAVLVILVIIFLLVFPNVEKIISKSKNTISETQINKILLASYEWSLKNSIRLPESNNKIFITLGQLKSEGLIESDIKNPDTEELYPNNAVISIENVGSNYEYLDSNSILKGDYLYTFILNSMSSDHSPNIKLIGLIKNSEGNYVSEIDINQIFNDVEYEATSYDGIDLTSRVFVNITFNNISVEQIDTKRIGIYKIYYTVVDDNGYATQVVRNVIVTDKELPEIYFPENTIIDSTITELDLMENVSCTDNSGVCNITFNGTINFGVSETYIIEYTAQDSSGNTIKSKRSIKIE